MENIIIYTDGSAINNPGPGGYGIVMMYKNIRKEYSKGFRYTTNNRMELLGVIDALKKIKKVNIPITIYSDSRYVIDSIQKGWVFNWEKDKNFCKKKNEDLWRQYLELHRIYNPTFIWIKGHNGDKENEICDKLAFNASSNINSSINIDEGYELTQINIIN